MRIAFLAPLAILAAFCWSAAGAPAFAGSGSSHGGKGHAQYGGHGGKGHHGDRHHRKHRKHHRFGGGGWGGWLYCDQYDSDGRHWRASDSPMVWDADQWRSTLMPDFLRARGRCVERRIVVKKVVHRAIIVGGEPSPDLPAGGVRPVVRSFGAASNRLGDRATVVQKLKEPCGRGGPLILVWTGARAERVCTPPGAWRGRIMAPSEHLPLDKG
jgi:hypothetical protein